jgi:ribose-phosphate pyrophosphokinase
LLEAGARPELTVAATHGLFVGEAREKLRRSALKRLLVTDAIAPRWDAVEVVSVASLLAEFLRAIV